MTHWNYRVMRHVAPTSGEVWHAIHEVYYDEAGNPSSWTADEIWPVGETPEELRECLEAMAKAMEKPVLEYR